MPPRVCCSYTALMTEDAPEAAVMCVRFFLQTAHCQTLYSIDHGAKSLIRSIGFTHLVPMRPERGSSAGLWAGAGWRRREPDTFARPLACRLSDPARDSLAFSQWHAAAPAA